MYSALLQDGKIVTAREYDSEIHGKRLYCIDPNCKRQVIFVGKSESVAAHFKTTGKDEHTRHTKECGFYEPLDMIDSIQKAGEYQRVLSKGNMKEILVKLNMSKIDPDYESKVTEREKKEKEDVDPDKVKVKNDNKPPESISSVKSVVKLLTSYEPDILASIIVNVGGGYKVPLSELIINQVHAHELLWSDKTLQNVGYFVHGRVARVTKRARVMYINFYNVDDIPFTIVVFEKYWKHFTYSEEDLQNKDVLIFGYLRKNTYDDKEQTEIVIKSNKYLEFIRRKKKN